MLTMLVESEKAICPSYDQPGDESDLSIKDKIRDRDGHKCRACGKTNEQHLEETGRILDVHRLIPGVFYHANWCVTLCRECHDKQVRRTADVFWSEEVRWIMFNMYDERDAALWKRLCTAKVTPGCTIETIIEAGIRAMEAKVSELERSESLVTSDGLW